VAERPDCGRGRAATILGKGDWNFTFYATVKSCLNGPGHAAESSVFISATRTPLEQDGASSRPTRASLSRLRRPAVAGRGEPRGPSRFVVSNFERLVRTTRGPLSAPITRGRPR